MRFDFVTCQNNPTRREVPSSDGQFLCPVFDKPVSALFKQNLPTIFSASEQSQEELLTDELTNALAERYESAFRAEWRRNGVFETTSASPAASSARTAPRTLLDLPDDQLRDLRPLELHPLFPENLQQTLEGFLTALSFPYSTVSQEVFLRNLGWEKILRGVMDEDDRRWGNLQYGESAVFSWGNRAVERGLWEKCSPRANPKNNAGAENLDVARGDDALWSSHHHAPGRAPRAEGGSVASEANFVLISNATSDEIVTSLTGELFQEGRPTLILEEVVGTSMEALGRDCHGTADSRYCLRPYHASGLICSEYELKL